MDLGVAVPLQDPFLAVCACIRLVYKNSFEIDCLNFCIPIEASTTRFVYQRVYKTSAIDFGGAPFYRGAIARISPCWEMPWIFVYVLVYKNAKLVSLPSLDELSPECYASNRRLRLGEKAILVDAIECTSRAQNQSRYRTNSTMTN